MKLEPAIMEQLRRLAEEEGLVLLDTEFVGAGKNAVLRLVVDGDDGVNLDRCASISRQASALLDVEDPVAHGYTLEVSSPGLDRKLYGENDFNRFSGQRVEIKMAPSYRAHRSVTGELQGLDNGTVKVLGEANEVVELPFAEIFEARLEVDWETVMKKGKGGR